MKFKTAQRGIGLWGLIYVIATLGLIVMLLVKCGPVYLNQASISKILHEVAGKSQGATGDGDVADIKREIERRWDVDYIKNLDSKDVKIVRSDKGLKLSYEYEAREPLFYNIFIVMHFAEDIPIRGTAN